MADCLFCRVARREAPAKIVFEDERVLAFDDVRPQAPVHVLVIPKAHVASIDDVADIPADLLKALFEAVREVAGIKGIRESGYRVVINKGRDAGQAVFHLHIHVLGGRPMGWPPG